MNIKTSALSLYNLGYFQAAKDIATILRGLEVDDRTIELMQSELWRKYCNEKDTCTKQPLSELLSKVSIAI